MTLLFGGHVKVSRDQIVEYLGVTISYNLSWHDHIVTICNKSNSTCAFLQRNLRQYSPIVASLAYLTYVGFILFCPLMYVKRDIARL